MCDVIGNDVADGLDVADSPLSADADPEIKRIGLIQIVLFYNFLLPALLAPEQWGVATPWQTHADNSAKVLYATHRDQSNLSQSRSPLVTSEGPLNPRHAKAMETLAVVASIVSEVLSYSTGLIGAPYLLPDATSVTILAGVLFEEMEHQLYDFFKTMITFTRRCSLPLNRSREDDSMRKVLMTREFEALEDVLDDSWIRLKQYAADPSFGALVLGEIIVGCLTPILGDPQTSVPQRVPFDDSSSDS
jgi:hypothetical protein